MSDAKVVRISQNLGRAVRNAIEFLCDTLEHSPPRRSGRFEISMQVCIEEIGEHGEVIGRFEFDQDMTKLVIIEGKVRN